jgi:hypothetical protein
LSYYKHYLFASFGATATTATFFLLIPYIFYEIRMKCYNIGKSGGGGGGGGGRWRFQ